MKIQPKIFLYIAWIQSIVATLGSLFMSEILKYPPCVLCWYQRIFLYPLTLILLIGLLTKDKFMPKYVLALTFVGWPIALYHNLLYYQILPESIAPCLNGVSCTTRFFAWFGFITIPLLSLSAYTVIIACMFLYLKSSAKQH